MAERSLDVDLLIVGAGPAGLFGAYYAGFRGLGVAVVDSLPELGGQISAMYPEKEIFDVAGFAAGNITDYPGNSGYCQVVCPVPAVGNDRDGDGGSEFLADNAVFFTEVLPDVIRPWATREVPSRPDGSGSTPPWWPGSRSYRRADDGGFRTGPGAHGPRGA